MTDEQKAQIHAHFETVGKSCNKDSTIITADDIIKLRARKMPTGPNAPCFLACLMKQIGIVSIVDICIYTQFYHLFIQNVMHISQANYDTILTEIWLNLWWEMLHPYEMSTIDTSLF